MLAVFGIIRSGVKGNALYCNLARTVAAVVVGIIDDAKLAWSHAVYLVIRQDAVTPALLGFHGCHVVLGSVADLE